MMHIENDQLVLFHYGESDDAEAVRAHLESCPECRLEYQKLTRLLAAVDSAPVPERSESYANEVWQTIRPQIEAEAKTKPVVVNMRRRWVAVAAVAASLIFAFALGRFWPQGDIQLAQEETAGNVRERVIVIAIGDHLERSQMMLIDFVHAEGNGTVDIGLQQERAADLVADNRLFRLAAESEGDMGTAALLDELERLLMTVANSDAELPAEEFESIRRRIDDKGLLFKVRVVGGNLRRQGADSPRDTLHYTI